jgi:hypothetical protein
MSSSQTQATWFVTEALFLVTLSLICAVAFAQTNGAAGTAGDGARGSTPPGTSQDGSRPADGAIKGGSAGAGATASGANRGSSIAPGETGGLPNRAPSESAEGQKRCDELNGSLRDQCLEKERADTATPRDPHQVLKKPY